MTPLPPDLVTRLAEGAGAPEGIHTVEALADLWLADHRQAGELREPPGDDDLPWSVDCVFELDAYPELVWVFVLQVIARAETRHQIGMLAAGALEDLIANHGATVIERIETEARRSPRFRYTLTGVWPQGNRGTAIWARIEAARIGAMETGFDAGGPLPPA